MSNLTKQILEMATEGIWFRDIFLEIDGSHDAIKTAMKEAKKKGMYSIADMRDEKKGTYYQFDGESK